MTPLHKNCDASTSTGLTSDAPCAEAEALATVPNAQDPRIAALRARLEPRRGRVALVVILALVFLVARALPRGEEAPAADPHAGHAHAAGGGDAKKEEVWTCSMHPDVRQPEPGTCPICGMDLIRAAVSGGEALKADEVRLGPRALALANLRVAPVDVLTHGATTHRFTGQITADETRTRSVTAWVGGRVDDLVVDTTGQRVRKGQVIARLYSPEVYAGHRELLAANAQLDRLKAADPLVRRGAEATRDAARQKLRLLGVRDDDLRRMEAASAPWTSVSIRSPFSGVVLDRLVSQGQYVQAGQALYRIADLSRVWGQLDVYAQQLDGLRVGQRVRVVPQSSPQSPVDATIRFIDPVVDPDKLTARARVELDNRDGQLRPGQYIEATTAREMAPPGAPLPLVVPRSALLYAGRRALVYIEKPRDRADAPPVYQAREVVPGEPVGDRVIVRAGLARGERVVVHGAFTLDADLQLRGGLSLMARPDDLTRAERAEPLDAPLAFRAAMAPVLNGYLDTQEALAADDLPRAMRHVATWREAITRAGAPPPGPAAVLWEDARARLIHDLSALASAQTLRAARATFVHLTRTTEQLLTAFGNPLDRTVRVAFCPMAFDNKGAEWLQRGDTIDNAYFGAQMRRCGEFRAEVAPQAHLLRAQGGQR